MPLTLCQTNLYFAHFLRSSIIRSDKCANLRCERSFCGRKMCLLCAISSKFVKQNTMAVCWFICSSYPESLWEPHQHLFRLNLACSRGDRCRSKSHLENEAPFASLHAIMLCFLLPVPPSFTIPLSWLLSASFAHQSYDVHTEELPPAHTFKWAEIYLYIYLYVSKKRVSSCGHPPPYNILK